MKIKFAHSLKPVGALALATLFAAASASADPWKFGVLSDTQRTVTDDGKNPNTIAANIIKQVDGQFIAAGVKLVIAVGDMVDTGSQPNDYVRALYALDLYNAGIAFYPTRGNHEAANGTYTGSGADFLHAYPQIIGPMAGWNNYTPADITAALVNPPGDVANNPPATKTGTSFQLGGNFSGPTLANSANSSVSYAFNFNNVTFMLLDQFQSPDYYTSHIIPEQQDWITSTLSGRPANTHAFAFTHKNILGGNHKDNMFGGQVASSDPGDCDGVNFSSLSAANQAAMIAKTNAENTFLALLEAHQVKYMISGHDHHHYNSIVTSPDQQSKVHQLICASDSSKFYIPGKPVSANDLPVEQDLGRVGYYLFTVDGPRVTIEYYTDATPNNYSGPFTFVKRSATGYSLNGQEFTVAEGAPYTVVTDNTTKAVANGETGYHGTMMQILAGVNTSTAANNYGKAQVKAVNTGWAPAQEGLASDILTLWGMADLGTTQTSAHVLLMSFDKNAPREQLGNGGFGIATRDSNGNWVNAASMTSAGVAQFAKGSWKPNHPVGTYGVDPSTKTAWAVIDYNGDFAVTTGIEPPPGHRK